MKMTQGRISQKMNGTYVENELVTEGTKETGV